MRGAAFDEEVLYVAGSQSGLQVFDVSRPQIPRPLGNLEVPGDAYGAATLDNCVVLAMFSDGIVTAPLQCDATSGVGGNHHGNTTLLLSPSPNPSRGHVWFRLPSPLTGIARMTIHDPSGRLVRTLERELRTPTPTAGSVHWDGLDDAGRPVANGVYEGRVHSAGEVAAARCVILR